MSKKGNRFENKHNRNLGYSERKFERQLAEIPSMRQMEYYNDLLKKCSEYGIETPLKKPTTSQEYSDAISELQIILKQNRCKENDENEMLVLFRKMTSAQKVLLISYAKGMLEKSGGLKQSRNNGKKNKAPSSR